MSTHRDLQRDTGSFTRRLTLPHSTAISDPGVPGSVIYHPVNKLVYYYDGTSWKDLTGATGGSGAYSSEQVSSNNSTTTNNKVNSLIGGENLMWGARIGGASDELYPSISVNSTGEVAVCCHYNSNPVVIYNTDGTTGFTGTNSGSIDVVIAKYGATGMSQWISRIAGTSDENYSSISINDNGEIAASCHYDSNLVTVYNANGTAGFTGGNSGGNDVVIAKLGALGTVSWGARIGGASGDEYSSISMNNTGEIAVACMYNSPVVVVYNTDGTTGFTGANDGDGYYDVVVAKYGSTGMVDWGARIGGITGEQYPSVSINSAGEIAVCCHYDSPIVAVYNTDGTTGFTGINDGDGYFDVVVAKYGATGMVDWGARIGGTSGEDYPSVSINDVGEVAVACGYNSTVIAVYNTDGTTGFTGGNDGNFDVVLARYGTTGMVNWGARIGGSGNEDYPSVSINSTGEVTVACKYTSSVVTAYNTDGTTGFTGIKDGSTDVVVARYGTTGMVDWGARIGGPGTKGEPSISMNDNGEVAVSTDYTSTVAIYNLDGTTGFTGGNDGGNDVIISKYGSGVILADGTMVGTYKQITNSTSSTLKVIGNIRLMTGVVVSSIQLGPGGSMNVIWTSSSIWQETV